MGQIASYQFDVFISYSRRDNATMPGKDHGWVDRFHHELENWVRNRYSYPKFSVWRDVSAMHGNTDFDSAIKQNLKTSALFFALLSRNYLSSEWCRKELDFFHGYHGQHPGGLKIGEGVRIFNILLDDIPYDQWPKQLEGTGGFPMNDGKQSGDPGGLLLPGSDAYTDRFFAIVKAIDSIVRKFPATAQPKLAEAQPEKKVRIFLADVPDSLRAKRKRLQQELPEASSLILPGLPPPYPRHEHEQQLLSVLAEAELSIHLLDQWPGRPLEDFEERDYPGEQALLTGQSPVRQLIWLPEEVRIEQVEEDAHRKLLLELRDGERNGQREFFHGGFSAFSQSLQDILQNWQFSDQGEAAPRTVLIDTHIRDQSQAFVLAGALAQRAVNVDFSKVSDDGRESLNFEQAVAQARDLVIMFGRVPAEWLEQRIKKAIKVAVSQLDLDTRLALEKIWVLMLPASGGRAPKLNIPRLINVEWLDNSHAEEVDPGFVEKLSQLATAGEHG